MRKDIEFKKVEDIAMAVVPKEEDVQGNTFYQAYLLNLKNHPIKNVLIRTKGQGLVEDRVVKTSTMRFLIENLPPQEFVAIELLTEELLNLSNEYWISFWHDDYLYDKKYVFVPGSILENHFRNIPLIDKKGVLIV